MTVAAATREAVRNRPALYDALRAGLLNYTAAADSLSVDGDPDAIATALRRFAAELEDAPSKGRSVTVRLHSNVESLDTPDTLLAVDGAAVGQPTGGPSAADSAPVELDGQSALRVTGDVDSRLLAGVLDRLRIAEIPVAAAGITGDTLVVVVPRRDGPTAVQLIETMAEAL